ncbi:MAG: translation initiation factor IF-2 subunit beta [Candidatus Aenigmarchaeota archaeon]|nr:translation initiation factor IF-2 subunit beta [Candidatus Aenigmarchaeota archaeon]
MTDYENLLERCICKMPEDCKESGRFTMPRAQVLIQGARTIFVNFRDAATELRRDPKHMLKVIAKDLATSYEESGNKVIFQGRFPGPLMNRKLESYVKNFVLCPNCCKPDTKIMKVGRDDILKCEACGSKSPLKKI